MRFSLLAGIIFMFSISSHAAIGSWSHFKHTLINAGSVHDLQQGISHSEGQGYGMLLAVHFNDKDTFDAIWDWTKKKLQVRNDYLFAWSYGTQKNGHLGVLDKNNATDGELIIAYSLLLAYQRWENKSYKKESLKILDDVKRKLTFSFEKKDFLLPGYYGFSKPQSTTWNPSYQIPSAFKLFSVHHNKQFWDNISINSLNLIERSSNNFIGLPPDWVTLKSDNAIVMKKNTAFGYEAIRVLLYQLWSDENRFPKGVASLFQKFKLNGRLPSTISLSGISIKNSSEASAGYYKILSQVAKKQNDCALAKKLSKKASQLIQQQPTDYYSQVTYLLAQLEEY